MMTTQIIQNNDIADKTEKFLPKDEFFYR